MITNLQEYPIVCGKFDTPTVVTTLLDVILAWFLRYPNTMAHATVVDTDERRALTTVPSGALVYQSSDYAMYKFTGTNPSVAGDWTPIGIQVADETAKLGLVLTPANVGYMAYQTDVGKWYRFIGDPLNLAGSDATNAAHWLECSERGFYTTHLYDFIDRLGTVTKIIVDLTSSGDPLYVAYSPIKNGNGAAIYDPNTMVDYAYKISGGGIFSTECHASPRDIILLGAGSTAYFWIQFDR